MSIYSTEVFEDLLTIVNRDFSKIVTIPNVWREVDNLLNKFTGENKSKYCSIIKNLEEESNERYFKSSEGINNIFFRQIGLTDYNNFFQLNLGNMYCIKFDRDFILNI